MLNLDQVLNMAHPLAILLVELPVIAQYINVVVVRQRVRWRARLGDL
jgi:hypothetical protein